MTQGKADYLPITDQPIAPVGCIIIAFLTLIFGLCFSSLANAAVDQKRVALVIGNSTYTHTTLLKNPKNDAEDVAAALRRLGFYVIEGTDLAHQQMREKVRAFASKIEGADVALFYYAGHGVQVDGNNYLAPVGARLRTESDLDFETVGLNFILRQMEREKRTNLVFLDACRDNPLSQKLARSMKTRSTAVGRGLARVESGVGMMIGYATSPGNVALDGKGRNSPYTTALLKHIEEPGVGINDMMIQVRNAVVLASNGKQVPWEHSSLTGQFYFKPKLKKVAAVETSAPKAPEKPKSKISSDLTNRTLVSSAYQATVAVGTCGAYRVFEEQHRGTFYGRLAEEWLKSNCAKKERKVQVEATGTTAKDKKASKVEAVEQKTVKDTTAKAKLGGDKKIETKPVVVAAVKPTDTTETKPVADKLTGSALVLAIQKQLGRLGCRPGRPDGTWGRRSQNALRKFDKFAKLDLSSDAPSATVLATLRGKTDRVCPLECGAQFVAKGDRCLRKICSTGEVLNSAGQCVVRAKPEKKTKSVSKKVEPPAVTKPRPPATKKPVRKKTKTASKRIEPAPKKKAVKKKAKKRVARKPPRRRVPPRRRRSAPKPGSWCNPGSRIEFLRCP